MPNQKLLDIVISLDKKQQKRLLLFVQSPYFNNRSNAQNITALLQIIIKNKANYDAPKLAKERLQQYFFPDKPYLEKVKNAIDGLASELNKLVEQFVVQEELAEEIDKKASYALGRFYQTKGNSNRFWPIIDKFRKNWNNQKSHNSADYYLRFQVEEIAASFASYFEPNTDKSSIQAVDEYLSKAFFAKKFELGALHAFSKYAANNTEASSDHLLSYIIEVYPQTSSVHTNLADLYYLAYRLLSVDDDRALFLRFEKMLEDKKEFIPEDERSTINAFYRYFVGRNYKLAGDTSLSDKLFVLYKEHLAKGFFFFSGGKIFHGTLKLLVNFGLKKGAVDWVEELLTQITSSKILGTKYPEDIHSLCMAELLFAKKEYIESESQIVYRLFEDFNFSLSCDILLVKIYFHTQNDLLDSRVRAMELKVRRADLLEIDKESYLFFISLVRRIDKYVWLKDAQKIAQIKAEIQSEKPLIQREWLLDIISK